jgi:hypothetical protein
VLATCLITALLSPPNNGDVLAYHLPRVRHWIQNRSFAHYPTHSPHQISLPFGAGYPVAHLQLLSGGDRFASVAQWAALVGCVVVAASLARRLFGARALVPAAVACATVPMAVLQASNAQSDLVTSFWLLCFVHLVFERRRRWTDVAWLGGALGLAVATKPTALLFAPPFVVILGLRAARAGWRRGVAVPIAVVVVAVLPALPNAVRNARTFGTPLGPDLGLTLQRHDPAARRVERPAPGGAQLSVDRALERHRLAARARPARRRQRSRDDRRADGVRAAHGARVPEPRREPGREPRARDAGAGRRRRSAADRAASTARLGVEARAADAGDRRRVPAVLRGDPLAAVGQSAAAAAAPARLAADGLGARAGADACPRRARGRAGRAGHAVRRVVGPASAGRAPRGARAVAARTDARRSDVRRGRAAVRRAHAARVLRRAVPARRHRGVPRVGLISGPDEPEYLVWRAIDRAGGPAQIRNVDVTNASRAARAELPGLDTCATIVIENGRAEMRAR